VCSNISTVRHCPKTCRRAWGEILSKTLRAIKTSPTKVARWTLLFALPKLVLRVPTRKRKPSSRFRAADHISSLMTRARRGDWQGLFAEAEAGAPKPTANQKGPERKVMTARDIKFKVMQLAQEGQFAKAVKNLVSEGLCELDEDTMEELRKKHPQPPPAMGESKEDSREITHETEEGCSVTPVFDHADVLKALRSFPKGTAAGASGFRAQHLLDAVSDPAKEETESVLSVLADVCSLLAAGKAPAEIAPWVASAPIYPLNKRGRHTPHRGG